MTNEEYKTLIINMVNAINNRIILIKIYSYIKVKYDKLK